MDDKGNRVNRVYYRQDLLPIDKKNLIKNAGEKIHDDEPILPKNTQVEDILNMRAQDVKKIYKRAFEKEIDFKLNESNRRKIIEKLRKFIEDNS